MTMNDEKTSGFWIDQTMIIWRQVDFDTSNMPSFWIFRGLIDDPGLDEQMFNAQKKTSNLK